MSPFELSLFGTTSRAVGIDDHDLSALEPLYQGIWTMGQ